MSFREEMEEDNVNYLQGHVLTGKSLGLKICAHS